MQHLIGKWLESGTRELYSSARRNEKEYAVAVMHLVFHIRTPFNCLSHDQAVTPHTPGI